jgi:hypothetical protein
MRRLLVALVALVGLVWWGLSGSPAVAQPIDSTTTFAQRVGTQRLSAVALSTVEPRYRWLVDLGYSYSRSPLMATHTGITGIRNLVADQHQTELKLVLGLPYVQVGLAMPLVVYQNGEPWTDSAGQPHDGVHWFAVGDLRLHAKAMLLDPRRYGFGIALAVDLGVPTGQGDHFTGSPSVVFRPRLVLDYWVKRIAYFALNVAYVLRQAERIEELVIDDQLEFSLGIMVRFGVLGRPFYLFGEIVAATQVSDPFATDGGTPVEGRFGIRLSNSDNFFLEIGWGAALRHADGLPRYRVMINLGLTFLMPGMSRAKERPPDRDGDGIPDSRDRCPKQAEDLDGFEDSDGCPEPEEAVLSPKDRKQYRRPVKPRWWQKWRKKRDRAKDKRARKAAQKKRGAAARKTTSPDGKALSRLQKRLKERAKRLSKKIRKLSKRLKAGSKNIKKTAGRLKHKIKQARPRPRPRPRPRRTPPRP